VDLHGCIIYRGLEFVNSDTGIVIVCVHTTHGYYYGSTHKFKSTAHMQAFLNLPSPFLSSLHFMTLLRDTYAVSQHWANLLIHMKTYWFPSLSSKKVPPTARKNMA